MEQNQFIDLIRSIIRTELNNLNLLQGQWHLGKVASIIDSKKLTAYIDGSTIAQTIGCNPNATFAVDDEIWVIFINSNSNDKFALCKRAV